MDGYKLNMLPWIFGYGYMFEFMYMGVSLNGGIPKTPQNDHF